MLLLHKKYNRAERVRLSLRRRYPAWRTPRRLRPLLDGEARSRGRAGSSRGRSSSPSNAQPRLLLSTGTRHGFTERPTPLLVPHCDSTVGHGRALRHRGNKALSWPPRSQSARSGPSLRLRSSSEPPVLLAAPPQRGPRRTTTASEHHDSAAQMSVAVPLVDFSVNTPSTSVYTTRPT
jgi:hypothetical protein